MSVHCRYLPIFPVREKFHKKYIKTQRSRRLRRPEGEPEGVHPTPRRPVGAAPLVAGPGGRLGGGHLPWCPLRPIFTPRDRKAKKKTPHREILPCSTAAV